MRPWGDPKPFYQQSRSISRYLEKTCLAHFPSGPSQSPLAELKAGMIAQEKGPITGLVFYFRKGFIVLYIKDAH